MASPKVSVLMTVYNAEAHLREAIDSVLRQDFTDFEFIIINDGSSDDSQAIIDHYQKLDKRIVALSQPNHGLVYSLNKGIKQAKGQFIARMDSDDVCMDYRFSSQVAFLEANPQVVLLGGSFEIINEQGWFIETVHPPLRDEDVRRSMFLRNPFGHASVMFRKQAVIDAGLYSDQYGPTEDYELWIRLHGHGKFAALPQPLYRYRINTAGISINSGGVQAEITKQHQAKLWAQEPPRVLSRQEVKRQAGRYLRSASIVSYGVAIKHQFLSDNIQIGLKLIRHGNMLKGLHQILNVASTGRAGMHALKNRLSILWRNLRGRLRR